MKKCVIGQKVGMTQIVSEEGVICPVTVVRVGPCSVLTAQVASEGSAHGLVTLGFQDLAEKKCNKPQLGHFAKLGISPKKYIRGFKVDSISDFEVKQVLDASLFDEKEKVNVRGRSVGKGFAGTIKRHNFSRGPRSHGSKNYRAPGSIGAGTTPGRVLKGKRMAGHMGDATVTVRGLIVVRVDVEKGLIFLKGAVPGKPAAILEIFN
jgi:large subunit ribosomal protein L3